MRLTAALTILLACAGTARAAPVTGAERRAVLDAARVHVERELGKPVRFVVERLDGRAGFAFLLARMQQPDGKRFSYAGTPMAGAAAQGMASDDYAALLHKVGHDWRAIAYVIGPTDVAWQDWSQEYHAPAALFGPQSDGNR